MGKRTRAGNEIQFADGFLIGIYKRSNSARETHFILYDEKRKTRFPDTALEIVALNFISKTYLPVYILPV